MTLSVCPACLSVHGKSSSSNELLTSDNPSECALESSPETFHEVHSIYLTSLTPAGQLGLSSLRRMMSVQEVVYLSLIKIISKIPTE